MQNAKCLTIPCLNVFVVSQDKPPIKVARVAKEVKPLINKTLPTPIKFHKLEQKVAGYNTADIQYLREGFSNRFYLGCSTATNNCLKVNNLKSADLNPVSVQKYLEKEMSMNRIEGPLASLPFNFFQINPLGLVAKKEPNTFRAIVDLSFPPGKSINDSIPDLSAEVAYCSITEAVNRIIANGPNSFLSKVDIEKAFRLIPIHPKHYHQLCIHWQGQFFIDKCLPMGARSACQLFERFSSALEFAALASGVNNLCHYLDDFLIISNSKEQGLEDLNLFLDLCEEVKVPVAKNKTEGPVQILTFLGLEIDTIKEEIRLPSDKLSKCYALIDELLCRKKCTLRELQVILGLLNFTCQVIIPGRAFLRRLYALTAKVAKPYHSIHLTRESKSDLLLWKQFLSSHNGITLYRDELFLSPEVKHIFTDSSKTLAAAAVFGSAWFSLPWPSVWYCEQNITFLELIPIVWAIETWGPLLRNCYLVVHTDNLALKFILNSQSAKEVLVMNLVRRLVLCLLTNNIMFTAKHIPGYKNILADSLSRLRFDKFKQFFPTANPNPSTTNPLPLEF